MPAGYAALIDMYGSESRSAASAGGDRQRHHPVSTREWLVVSPRLAPAPSLEGQLEFALKREGVDLAVLSALFEEVPAREIAALVRRTPTGQYSRRAWFLYERRLVFGSTASLSVDRCAWHPRPVTAPEG